MTNAADQIRASLRAAAALLDALDAVRHRRAATLMAATLIVLAIWLTALGEVSAQAGAGSAAVGGLLALLAILGGAAVLLVGGTAAGLLLADEVWQRPPRGIGEALRAAAALAPRGLGATLLAAAVPAVHLLVLAALLLICRIPFVGPLLYAVVLPAAALAGGLLLFALCGLALPLAAPCLWNGADLCRTLATLREILQRRLLDAFVMTGGLGLLVGVVAGALVLIVTAGSGLTLWLSSAVLDEGTANGAAATFGMALLAALAAMPPLLVALKGAAIGHRQLSAGLAIDEATADLRHRLDALRRRAFASRARPAPSAPPAGGARVCPNAHCGAPVGADDAFCIACGERLK